MSALTILIIRHARGWQRAGTWAASRRLATTWRAAGRMKRCFRCAGGCISIPSWTTAWATKRTL